MINDLRRLLNEDPLPLTNLLLPLLPSLLTAWHFYRLNRLFVGTSFVSSN